MRTLILYESKFGNTAQIARPIADDLSSLGQVAVASIDEGLPDLDSVGLLVVCGPTQGHGVSAALRTLLDRIPAGALEGIAAAAFDTRVRGPRWLTGSAYEGHREEAGAERSTADCSGGKFHRRWQ
jgi:menaquinone-dependent protoporphyrinogen IX oxidase